MNFSTAIFLVVVVVFVFIIYSPLVIDEIFCMMNGSDSTVRLSGS